jgi:predicted Co/Zn/Cd cation transporter (cation efflux family)
MWRCLPALVFIAFLLYYDATHTATKPFRLALYAFCVMLVLLCLRALGRYS